MVGVMVLADAVGTAGGAPAVGAVPAAAWTIGPMAVVAVVTHLFVLWCGRRLDESGLSVYIDRAERAVHLSRLVYALLHAWGVLALGWVGAVRSVTGDLPAVDEVVALIPAVCGFACGWASYYGIDRRIREASLMGVLDGAAPVLTLPGRWEFVLDQVRHNVLIVLLPMALITLWSEGSAMLADWWLNGREDLLRDPDVAWGVAWGFGLLQFGGVLIVLLLMPLGLRYVWSTSRLGPGAVRDRLAGLCERQRVRCREFLVWHTHTGMVNGALVGVLPRLRYILLTDALLERLSEPQVEAVMAHEVGHAARRHIPWMVAATVVSVSLLHALGAWMMTFVGAEWMRLRLADGHSDGPEFGVAIAGGLLIFGWVSRRFEQQADAFAAQHLSGWSVRRGAPRPAPLILPEAAGAMSGALSAVARIAHLPEHRFTFRHGSIAARKRNVLALAGIPADRVPIDRVVRRIKAAVLLGGAVLVAISMRVP